MLRGVILVPTKQTVLVKMFDILTAEKLNKVIQGNKKFKETRNWIFISIFIIYILLLKVGFNERFKKCNLDSMIKNIIINKS